MYYLDSHSVEFSMEVCFNPFLFLTSSIGFICCLRKSSAPLRHIRVCDAFEAGSDHHFQVFDVRACVRISPTGLRLRRQDCGGILSPL